MAVYELIANSTTLFLGGTCLLLLILYDYWTKLYFKRQGIPGPFPLPIIGTFYASTKGFTTDFLAKKQKYGKVYGLSIVTNSFVVHDLDMLKDIMISQFSAFPNHVVSEILFLCDKLIQRRA
ncbi:Cytochrome P450 3A13 [Holothuria leucospilota]|uniref:Cytochrome P450 3A13 n=1 Tax=Holothuria leucospilota TaxID=206669 RepID=A0A9Q1B9W1_HOLLE|nr:Cytochrome P450 3A13 [Holothuria leucospilota]